MDMGARSSSIASGLSAVSKACIERSTGCGPMSHCRGLSDPAGYFHRASRAVPSATCRSSRVNGGFVMRKAACRGDAAPILMSWPRESSGGAARESFHEWAHRGDDGIRLLVQSVGNLRRSEERRGRSRLLETTGEYGAGQFVGVWAYLSKQLRPCVSAFRGDVHARCSARRRVSPRANGLVRG